MDTTIPRSDAAHALESLWSAGEQPELRAFLVSRPPLSVRDLLAVFRVDRHHRLQAGHAVRTETYLALMPTAGADDGSALESMIREMIDREGDPPSLSTGEIPPPSDHRLPTIAGYEVVERLGQGGMGSVYLARDRTLGRFVAIKTIRSEFLDNAELRARFETEAVAVARLQHPNIVQVFGSGQGTIFGSPMPFLALEFILGQPLDRVLDNKPQGPRWCAELLACLARAVHHAHEKGIVHRDLKPNNVLVTQAGTPKVTDFGLAKILDRDDFTRAGAVFGTPNFMSPEQTSGSGNQIGPPTDIWSLGVILYQALTGRLPFLGQTGEETYQQIRAFDPVAPSTLQPAVPRDLETIALKCLHKRIEQRYASCSDLADDLDRFLHGEPIRARPPGPVERAARFLRRHAILATASAIVFVTLAVALLLVSQALFQARNDRELAKDETQKAIEAEQAQARLVARGHLQLALLYRQQGKWKPALEELEAAHLGGHPEPARLRLEKIQVLIALNRDDEAKQELRRLNDDPDVADHRAQALLWEADLLLGEDTEKATRLIREAVATKKLSPAEIAYARGLLAERATDAVTAFQEVLAFEPLHLRANQMLALSLIVLGRLDEVDRCLLIAGASYPRDPNVLMLTAFLSALRGDKVLLARQLAALAPEIDERQAKRFKAVVEIFVEEFPRFDFWCWQANLWDQARLMGRALPLLRNASTKGDKPDSLRLPPFFVRQGALFLDLLSPLQFQQSAARIQKLAAEHPEGFLTFLHGHSLFSRGRRREAEAVLQRAAELPALIPVRRSALSLLARTQAALFDAATGTERARLKASLRKTLQELLAHSASDIPVLREEFCDIAVLIGEIDLARRFVLRWREADPTDRTARVNHAYIEYRGTAYKRAEEIAKAVLAESPGDESAKKLLAKIQADRDKKP